MSATILGLEADAVMLMVTVLYGPKGCGKTRFFEALYNSLEDVYTDIDMIIVGAEERDCQGLY